MPKVVPKKNNIKSQTAKNPDGSLLNHGARSPHPLPSASKKRGRPKKSPPSYSYPPPPPPPPPPANNPYYQKFFEDYWRKYSQGFQVPGGPNAAPPPPPPPPGAPMVILPPTTFTPETAVNDNNNGGDHLAVESTLEYPIKSDRKTFVLADPDDIKHISEKQCYLRSRLAEIFLSEKSDVEASVRGRKSRFTGQVGLRCVFCVPSNDPKNRVERAICYPTQINKFYQTAQDMQHFHFNACPAIPPEVKEVYRSLKGNMNSRRGGEDRVAPKDYWVKHCKEMGLVDHIADDGSNAGVKFKEGHKLVPRAMLPEYKMELFMPPSKEDDDDDGEGEMAQVLAKEVKEGGNNEGGFDKLVADLDGKSGDKDAESKKVDDEKANNEKDEDDKDESVKAEEEPMKVDEPPVEVDDKEGKDDKNEEENDESEKAEEEIMEVDEPPVEVDGGDSKGENDNSQDEDENEKSKDEPAEVDVKMESDEKEEDEDDNNESEKAEDEPIEVDGKVESDEGDDDEDVKNDDEEDGESC